MLEELELSNFRLFGEKVNIRFRPITIFIGENNAGKSSVIKFLMMLKQSIGSVGSGFLVTNGSEVSLGRNFYGLKNINSKKRNLDFSLKVGEHGSPSSRVLEYLKERDLYSPEKKRFATYQATVTYNKKNQFLGKDHKIIFSAGKKEITNQKEKITPNSSFMLFESTQAPSGNEQTNTPLENFCIENLQYSLGELKYLSAMREELQGTISTDEISRKYVGKKGEKAIFELWQEELLTDKEKEQFLLMHTKKVLDIENISFKEVGRLAACDAVNCKTKARVNIGDFGFGVSQCMPIFIQGMLMPPGTQLIVEQPEAQVHPTAQIEMGSFFVDLWKKYRVGSIVETHSDNILLRIRNCIAREEISPNDVSIAYFTMRKKNPVVKNLDVYGNGIMQEGLPMEFFGGNLKELLDMGMQDE